MISEISDVTNLQNNVVTREVSTVFLWEIILNEIGAITQQSLGHETLRSEHIHRRAK